jgi:hypothetical protein
MKGNRIVLFYHFFRGNRRYLVLFSIIFIALFVDLSLVKLSNLLMKGPESAWRTYIFFVLGFICITGQFLVLEFVKRKSSQIARTEKLHIRSVHNIVTVVQYSVIGTLVFLMLQVALSPYYNTFALTSIAVMSYGLAVGVMIVLSHRFLSWFVFNRNLTVLLYGLASISITINAFLSLFFVLAISLGWPSIIRKFYASSTTYLEPGSAADALSFGIPISSVISFMLTWAATAMLLRHHSDKLGRARYWIMISIPLAYFLSQFSNLFLDLFAPLLQSIAFGITLILIFTLSKPVGGILFGVAFFTLAKKIRNSYVRDCLVISAYGFVLLFISNQIISLVYHPYPPFGIVTISFMGLSSYLILTGIYASAVSISQDSKLRQSIRKLAVQELKLLDSIGTAQMDHELQKRVSRITKETQDKMIETTGVGPSLDEEDAKQYLDEVLREIKNQGKKEETSG